MMWLLLQLNPVAEGLPCGSSADPLDQRHLSHRVEGGWLILQQSLRPQSFTNNLAAGETNFLAGTLSIHCSYERSFPPLPHTSPRAGRKRTFLTQLRDSHRRA